MNQSKMDTDLDMLMLEEMTEDFSLLGEEKKIGGQGLKKKKKHFKVKDTPKNVDEVVEGCWQKPPLEIIENIVQRLDLLDRIHGLSLLCKHWSSIALQRDIPNDHQFPWLLVIKAPWLLGATNPRPKYLELSIPPDGNVITLGLSKQNQGLFHSSCKDWLIMDNVENSEVFLLNPISGAKHELPSLTQIPSFGNFRAQNVRFLRKIALSSSNMSECTVAAFFSSKEIGVCRPGKNSWSFSPMSNDSNDSLLCLLFSSCGMLYALIDNNAKSGRVITRTLRFGDGDDLELKLVYDIKGKPREYYSTGLNIPNGFRYVYIKHKSYLIESTTNNELLLIHQFTDFRIKNDLGRETMTRDFVVYKLNEEDGGSFIEIQSLGNQILFLTSRGCSFSLPVSNSKGLEANCIYFLEMGVSSCMSDFSHPFYLNGRKFGKSRDDYSHAPPKRYWWGLSWFLPSLL